jgi:hypothetical protein
MESIKRQKREPVNIEKVIEITKEASSSPDSIKALSDCSEHVFRKVPVGACSLNKLLLF